ncbi:lytic polysaccharide monooxygenase [Lentithecium fluviatile CBS 122367]|uniref:Lytic polysaccharide monooxygenase n=1 Tax=Lentithecium fluviatile CBS 122367 TaxID=1168545 RepID=A0A6G1IQ94_9PLEO|nr:lytic polysaccharide monooxygenase [Lentithecium fluviatile CBS 122367]
MFVSLFTASLFALIPTISAHARIVNITTSAGTVYTGWDPELALSNAALPPLAAWSASNLGNIFVTPSRFNTSDIACHYNSTPGALHINTTAGDELKMQWNEWPVSHKGPVISYLAACNGSCANADKDTLEWVKIDELGWLNGTGFVGLGGTWASDVLIANHASWTVKIPELMAEGNYVLRHEIVALHVAEEANGAQAYPQCVNLRVAGSREGKKPEGGVVASRLYGMADKGILVNIHGNVTGYDIPGPRLWSHAVEFRQPNE